MPTDKILGIIEYEKFINEYEAKLYELNREN